MTDTEKINEIKKLLKAYIDNEKSVEDTIINEDYVTLIKILQIVIK